MNWHEKFNHIRELSREINELTGVKNPRPQHDKFNELIRDDELRTVTSKLFHDGHHARAVEEAFKFINNLTKKKANVDPSLDGSKLMKHVFSINSPVLKINAGTTVSEKDEQLGYMEIFSGSITGIRNPRAHEHEWEDTESHALQLLVLADHLVDRIRKSTKVI